MVLMWSSYFNDTLVLIGFLILIIDEIEINIPDTAITPSIYEVQATGQKFYNPYILESLAQL